MHKINYGKQYIFTGNIIAYNVIRGDTCILIGFNKEATYMPYQVKTDKFTFCVNSNEIKIKE